MCKKEQKVEGKKYFKKLTLPGLQKVKTGGKKVN